MSETINRQTGGRYADYQDFKNRFANDAYQFTLDVLKEMGEDQITSPNTASGSVIVPGGMSDTTNKLYNPTWPKSTFFTLDISKMGEYDNTDALEAGHWFNGGGFTKSKRLRRDGSLNEQASSLWPTPAGTKYTYRVLHHTPKDGGGYQLAESESLQAVYNTVVNATPKTYPDMEVDTANSNNALSKRILGTDQELRVYYKKRSGAPSQPDTPPAQPNQPSQPNQPPAQPPTNQNKPSGEVNKPGQSHKAPNSGYRPKVHNPAIIVGLVTIGSLIWLITKRK